MTVTWRDGKNEPPRPQELEERRRMPDQGGVYYGEKGTIILPHGGNPRLIPGSEDEGLQAARTYLAA